MEQEVREVLATFRAGDVDRPDLKNMVDTIVSTMNLYVFHRGYSYRLRTPLGRWTVEMQEERWQHPAHYGVVKRALVSVGQVGTRACQETWGREEMSVCNWTHIWLPHRSISSSMRGRTSPCYHTHAYRRRRLTRSLCGIAWRRCRQ